MYNDSIKSPHSFVKESYHNPANYEMPQDAPAWFDDVDSVTRHNLFEEHLPEHSRLYINGADSFTWRTPHGNVRSQFMLDQNLLLWLCHMSRLTMEEAGFFRRSIATTT